MGPIWFFPLRSRLGMPEVCKRASGPKERGSQHRLGGRSVPDERLMTPILPGGMRAACLQARQTSQCPGDYPACAFRATACADMIVIVNPWARLDHAP